MTEKLIPIPEAKEKHLGGIGTTTIYQLIKDGELQKVNIGRRSFITAESIDAYVKKLKASPEQPKQQPGRKDGRTYKPWDLSKPVDLKILDVTITQELS